MGKVDSSEQNLNATGLKVAIIASRYNIKVCDGLLNGAIEELQKLGLSKDEIPIYRVPGAFELPFLAKELATRKKLDTIICLGAVIRGETSHYDYVCQGATHGLLQAMLETRTPIAFGVLTTDNEAQAIARSSPDENNKGLEAARTAVEMANLKKDL